MFWKKKPKEKQSEEVDTPEYIELYDIWEQKQQIIDKLQKIYQNTRGIDNNLSCIFAFIVGSVILGGVLFVFAILL